jgi:hypothetical protein
MFVHVGFDARACVCVAVVTATREQSRHCRRRHSQVRAGVKSVTTHLCTRDCHTHDSEEASAHAATLIAQLCYGTLRSEVRCHGCGAGEAWCVMRMF